MVPEADFRSYYDDPVVSAPVWQPREIASYFFLGGLAGASSVLALGADLTGSAILARRAKLTAGGAIALSLAALVKDLGRSARFLNMLRVFKPTSPMNVGSWIVAGYAPLAIGAAASATTDVAVGLGRAATIGAAALGPAVASYTGVLIADSAIPAWHGPFREMPWLFVASAVASAAGAGLAGSGGEASGTLTRLALAGAAGEVIADAVIERRLGESGSAAYRNGVAGRLMGTSRLLVIAGAVGSVLAARSGRTVLRVLAGAALLGGSACTRFGVFYAGVASANDPRSTIQPQRKRLAQHTNEAEESSKTTVD